MWGCPRCGYYRYSVNPAEDIQRLYADWECPVCGCKPSEYNQNSKEGAPMSDDILTHLNRYNSKMDKLEIIFQRALREGDWTLCEAVQSEMDRVLEEITEKADSNLRKKLNPDGSPRNT